jgi:hypothetical protein
MTPSVKIFALIAAALVGCAQTPWQGSEAARKVRDNRVGPRSSQGDVRINCDILDADVYVDGVIQGSAADFDGSHALLYIGEGLHRVEIRKAGYQTYEAGVEGGNAVVVLNVHLLPN